MLNLKQAKKNLEDMQVYINKLRHNLEDLETDKFKDLKKAQSEGAIIEYDDGINGWAKSKTPYWNKNYKYHIKDNISISSWNAHKDLIKQYWNGAEMEYHSTIDGWKLAEPTWHTLANYRVKAKEMTLAEISRELGYDVKIVKER